MSYTTKYSTMGDVYFNQIQFVNENTGFVVGEGDSRGVILKTSDAGNTWNEVFVTNQSLVALKMVNENEGWAAGAIYARTSITTYFVRTMDGFQTAEEYESDLPYAVWAIDGFDPNLLFAVAFNTANTALLRFTE